MLGFERLSNEDPYIVLDWLICRGLPPSILRYSTENDGILPGHLL